MTFRLLAGLAALTLVASCATMSEEECLAGNWREIGSIGIKVREVPQECSCFRSLWICGTTDQFGAFRDVSALIAS